MSLCQGLIIIVQKSIANFGVKKRLTKERLLGHTRGSYERWYRKNIFGPTLQEKGAKWRPVGLRALRAG